MIDTKNQPQAVYTKVGGTPAPTASTVPGMPTTPTVPSSGGGVPKRPKRESSSKKKAIFAVIGLILFFAVALGAVLVSQKQRISRAPVAPTAPESRPAAYIEQGAACTLTFDVGELDCNSTCDPNALPDACTGANANWSCENTYSWSDPVAVDALPGSGDMQALSTYSLPGSFYQQKFWRGNQAYRRNIPIINSRLDWGNASDWENVESGTDLPGSGNVQALTIYRLPDGSNYQEAVWRDGQGFIRNIPVSGNLLNWDGAADWSNPVALTVLPGSGDFQAQSVYPLPNGTHYQQAFWRGNQGSVRQIPIVSNQLDWGNVTAWSDPISFSGIPGSGNGQALSTYRLPGGQYQQGVWRDNWGYSRTIPVESNAIQWSEITDYRCRLTSYPSTSNCTEPGVTPEAGCGASCNILQCESGFECIAATDGSYCSLPAYTTACGTADSSNSLELCCTEPTPISCGQNCEGGTCEEGLECVVSATSGSFCAQPAYVDTCTEASNIQSIPANYEFCCTGPTITVTPTDTLTPTPTATPVPGECGSNCEETACEGNLECIVAVDGSYCSETVYTSVCATADSNNAIALCCTEPTATPTPPPGSTPTPTWPPGTTPTPTPTWPPGTTPTPTIPVAVVTPPPGCNDTCTSNAECTAANSRYICYNSRCRLDSNPENEYCQEGQQPVLPTALPQTGPSDWVNALKAGLGILGIGALLLLLL